MQLKDFSLQQDFKTLHDKAPLDVYALCLGTNEKQSEEVQRIALPLLGTSQSPYLNVCFLKYL